MKKMFSALCATALAASIGLSGSLPASAAPLAMPQAAPAAQSDVVQVDTVWRKKNGWNGNRNVYRNNNNWNNKKQWNNGPKYGWYHGHRGYPYKRPGYRYYNGFWFPAGAFIAGAVIGGAIANNNNNNYGSSHVQWCYDRYRSYRASDNTFQPYNGPRQQCYSPYN
ncbi:MAG: BA14K family protein [Hyphomicrobiales bacterium]|nr:BA14K family protein [Hyphomicrobiales bacterium]